MIGKLAKFLRLFLAPMPPNLGPGELFSGVEKPTMTLAKMMAATIIEELPQGKDSRSVSQQTRSIDAKEYRTSKFTVERRRSHCDYRGWQDYSLIHTFSDVRFGTEEEAIIIAAIKTSESLRSQKAAIEAAEKVQHKAIDAIANWVGVPSKEEETV